MKSFRLLSQNAHSSIFKYWWDISGLKVQAGDFAELTDNRDLVERSSKMNYGYNQIRSM